MIDNSVKSSNNSSLGEFYTPKIVSENLRDLTSKHLGDDFCDKYTIWDCCCGDFALTKVLDIKDDNNLYCSTLRSVDIRKNRNQLGTKFVYDFLNDDCEKLVDYAEKLYGTYKMPDSLLDEFKQNNKPILFYINPPYASHSIYGNNKKTREKDFNLSYISNLMSNLGSAKSQLLANFLYRIILMKREYANKQIYLSIIMPISYFIVDSYKSFRKEFFKEFSLVGANVFSSKVFDLSGEFLLANMVFTPNIDKSYITEYDLDYYVLDKDNLIRDGRYLLYNSDNLEFSHNAYIKQYRNIGDSIAPLVMKSGSNIISNTENLAYSEKCLGYYYCSDSKLSSLVNKLLIVSFPFAQGGNYEINKNNFRDILTNFAVREILISIYRRSKLSDNAFLQPDFSSEAYKILKHNCLLVSLFASNSHFIGCVFDNTRYFNKFLHSKKLYQRLNYRKLLNSDFDFSKIDWFIGDELDKDLECAYMLPSGIDFYSKITHCYELAYSKRLDFYKLKPEYQTNLDDLGWYQVKFILKEYFKEEYKDIRNLYRVYIIDLVNLIFYAGFIRR